MTGVELRKFALLVLDDPEGIREEAYDLLHPYLDKDIQDEVGRHSGRAYIGEDFAEEELAKMHYLETGVEGNQESEKENEGKAEEETI